MLISDNLNEHRIPIWLNSFGISCFLISSIFNFSYLGLICQQKINSDNDPLRCNHNHSRRFYNLTRAKLTNNNHSALDYKRIIFAYRIEVDIDVDEMGVKERMLKYIAKLFRAISHLLLITTCPYKIICSKKCTIWKGSLCEIKSLSFSYSYS